MPLPWTYGYKTRCRGSTHSDCTSEPRTFLCVGFLWRTSTVLSPMCTDKRKRVPMGASTNNYKEKISKREYSQTRAFLYIIEISSKRANMDEECLFTYAFLPAYFWMWSTPVSIRQPRSLLQFVWRLPLKPCSGKWVFAISNYLNDWLILAHSRDLLHAYRGLVLRHLSKVDASGQLGSKQALLAELSFSWCGIALSHYDGASHS